jgi:hypothetical protein
LQKKLQFDELAQRHGVQKIDVIGDAYLAATNVMEDQVLEPTLAVDCSVARGFRRSRSAVRLQQRMTMCIINHSSHFQRVGFKLRMFFWLEMTGFDFYCSPRTTLHA